MLHMLIAPVMAVHLLALNLASAGPIVCLWLRRRRHPDHELRDRVGQRLAWWSVWALVLGMLLGGVLMLPDNPQQRAALARFPAKAYWNAAAELVFSLVCMVGYAAVWHRARQRPLLHGLMAILTATNLLYHFPPLMVVLGKLTKNAHWVGEAVIERKLFIQLMLRREVLALSMHFIVASFAVALAAVLWLSVREGKKVGNRRLAAWAALLTTLCTMMQLPIGVWVLMILSASSRRDLMGGDVLGTVCFMGGIVATLLLLQQLIAISLGNFGRPIVRRVVGLLGLVVLLMVATLRG